MPSANARRGIWIVGILAVAAAILVAALPMIASTQIVRDRIAQELSALTGYRVELARGPDISIWPTVTARLGDVALTAWSGDDVTPVFETEEIEVELSALAALRGKIVFSRVELIRPLLRVRPSGEILYPPTPSSAGRIGYAVDSARSRIAANAASPDLSALPNDPLGILEFTDGRILVADPEGEREAVTSVAGRVDWLALDRPAIVNATGIWRGEAATLSLTAPQPLVLMAGGQTTLALAFKSTPLEISFDGTANFGGDGFFDGAIRLASPSLRRLLEWSQSPMSLGAATGAVVATSSVNGTRQRLKFENTELTLDGNRGMGALEVSTAGGVPLVSGTLAFGELDLGSFLSAFTPLRTANGAQRGGVEAGFGRHVDLDLRLSASQASAGAVPLENVAATARVKDGLTVLDISDATAFGGTVQAGVRVDHQWDANQVEVRLLASDVDGAAVAASAGVTGMVPKARGALSIILKGTGADWNSVFETANGTLSMKLGQGAIDGVDLAAFLARVAEGDFFAFADIASSSLPIENAEVKATVAEGVATVERAQAVTPDRVIQLAGIVPYIGRGLALSGNIAPRAKEGEPQPASAAPIQFFVGGSWSAPFISPVLSSWTPE